MTRPIFTYTVAPCLPSELEPLRELAYNLFGRGITNWSSIKIVEVKADMPQELVVRDALTVHAWLDLRQLTPDDVRVELYQGQLDADGDILWPNPISMLAQGQTRGTLYEFACKVNLQTSGRHGYTVRVLPDHPNLGDAYKQGLILWA